jgi:lipopolysaccharide transport system permease protein
VLNPLGGTIDGFRAAIFGQPQDLEALAVAGALVALTVVASLTYFRQTERAFADLV